jgi:hypothetical protein
MVFTFIPMPFSGLSVQNSKNYDLKDESVVLKSNAFQNSNTSCFQGFFYINSLKKTGITTPCTTSATNTTLPNCNTGRYALCACGGVSNNDCSNCNHEGYIPLVSMNDKVIVLESLGAPDASRQGKASLQLTIKTIISGLLEDSSGNKLNPSKNPIDASGSSTDSAQSEVYIETFILPPIPFQKWIMITINREGRRFDIYYNGTLVLSKHTSANVYNTITSDEIKVGNSMLDGSCGFFNIYSTLQSASSIQASYTSLTNTRGSPLFNRNPPDISSTSLSLDRLSSGAGLPNIPSICSSGDCINSPNRPPSKPYYEWSSSYA